MGTRQPSMPGVTAIYSHILTWSLCEEAKRNIKEEHYVCVLDNQQGVANKIFKLILEFSAT